MTSVDPSDPDAGPGASAPLETGPTPDAETDPADATVTGASLDDRATPVRPDALPFVPPDAGALALEAGHGEGGCVEAGPITTYTLLAAQGRDCLWFEPDGAPAADACVVASGCLDPAQLGGDCETPPPGAFDPGRVFNCVNTYTKMCLQTLGDVFASGCFDTLTLTPCLCGTTDPKQCLGGATVPTGPVYNDYVNDFNTTKVGEILNEFTLQTYGAGQANALLQCIGSYGCLGCLRVSDGG